MIWVRRIIAIGLIFFALLLFIPALFLTELNNTVANPNFYNDQLERAEVYNFVYDEALPAALDNIEEDETSDLPVDIEEFKIDVVSALREILPPEWLQEQTESAIGELVPYLRGSSDEFTIIIPLLDKVDPTADAIIEIFDDPQTYDHLLEEVITPMVMEEFESSTELPFDVSLSQEEISSAIKEILPNTWLHDSFAGIVRACADYAKGADDISVVMDLTSNKAAASSVLTPLADEKLEAVFNTLPEVSAADFESAIVGLQEGNIPDVRPAGVVYDDFKEAIGLDVGYWVDEVVINEIPDQWSFTQDDIMGALGEDAENALNDARDNVVSGYTITEQDLTDKDGEENGGTEGLDTARHTINTARTWLWVLWVLPFMMLIGAGLLIARSLKGKILWFLGITFVMFLLFFAVIGLSYSVITEPHTQSVFGDPADYEGFDAAMIDKGNEIFDNALGTFFWGMQKMCLYAMLASGVVGIAYLGTDYGLRRRKQGQALQDENGQVLQDQMNGALPDENGEVMQDEGDQVMHDEETEALSDENDEVLQSEDDEVLQDDQVEEMLDENDEVQQDGKDNIF